jgi:hypothetical protein
MLDAIAAAQTAAKKPCRNFRLFILSFLEIGTWIRDALKASITTREQRIKATGEYLLIRFAGPETIVKNRVAYSTKRERLMRRSECPATSR